MARMSSAELAAYEARQKSKWGEPVFTGTSPEKESDLHQQILDECKRRNWIAFHGSMAHRTFRTKGEPDFIILADNGRWFLIEAKTAKGKLSTEQMALRAWAELLEHKVHLVRNIQEFMEAVKK